MILYHGTYQQFDSLDFPKVPRPTVSAKVKGLRGVVHFTHEEVEQDDRLKHILSR